MVSIQTALAIMEERARKAEERAFKTEERAIKMEERAIKAEETISYLKQQVDTMISQLDQIARAPVLSTPSPSYADVAYTAPNSNPSNI
jgi:homoserine acetyltransferase